MARGLPRAKETEVPDIRETLAQLDRRLADLGRQIHDLATEPEPAPPPPPPARSPLPMPTPAEFDAPAGGEGEAVRRPGLEAVDAAAAAEGIAQLGSQIQQLLTMRERLVADGRELLATYERQLRELEREDYAEVQSALASLLSPTVSTSSTPGQDPGVSPRPAFFEGTVAITVGGAQRIQTIQVVEDSLSRVRHAEQVYIRRWHAGALLLEVTLAAGVELIGELNRVLPFPFAVQSATGQQIVLALEGER